MKLNASSLIPGAGAATLLLLAACQQSESPAPSAPSAQETPPAVSSEVAPLKFAGPGQKPSDEQLARFLENRQDLPPAAAGITQAPLAKTAAALPNCTVNFDNQTSLKNLPNQANNSAALSPYYSQTCNASYTVISGPINAQAYRLIPENNYWCPAAVPKIGTRTAGGECVFPTDGFFWSRRLGNMSSNTGVSFNVHNSIHYKDFDLISLYIHEGTMEVWGFTPAGGWLFWPALAPKTKWNFPAGTTISQLQLFESGKNGSFQADNLVIAIHP
jgi:hypothetical protein